MFGRRVGVLVVVAALLGLVTVEPATAEDELPASPTNELGGDAPVDGDVVAVTDVWTASSRTYATGLDGVFVTESYAGPVNYQDGDGEWEPIDTSLVSAGEAGFEATSLPMEVSVADTADASVLSEVTLEDGVAAGYGLTDASSAPAAVTDSTAVFEDALGSADIELEVVPAGVKETIVLESAPSESSFVFPLELAGLTPALDEDGGVVLSDGSGEPRLAIPPGFMEDSASEPATSVGVTYSIEEAGSVLRVSLDMGWLQDPSRVYPVRVDPSLVLYSSGDDTYVNSGITANNSQALIMKVGQGPTYKNRAFLHLNTSSLAGMNIHQSSLELWPETAGGSCAAAHTDVYAVSESWQGSSTQAWPGPSIDADGVSQTSFYSGAGGGVGCPSAYVGADLTALVTDWASGVSTNLGVTLRARSESTLGEYREYASAQSSHPPSLTTVWSNPATAGSPLVPADLSPTGVLTTGQPTMSASYSDPQGDPGFVRFIFYDQTTGEYLRAATSSQVASGSTASVTLGTPLELDREYRVRAVAWDTNFKYSYLSPGDRLIHPSVRVTSPADDAVLGGTTVYEAQLATGVTATAVSFLLDGTSVGSDTTAPYSITSVDVSSYDDGSHELVARVDGGSSNGVLSPVVVVGVGDEEVIEDADEGDPEASSLGRCKTEYFCLYLLTRYNVDNPQADLVAKFADEWDVCFCPLGGETANLHHARLNGPAIPLPDGRLSNRSLSMKNWGISCQVWLFSGRVFRGRSVSLPPNAVRSIGDLRNFRMGNLGTSYYFCGLPDLDN